MLKFISRWGPVAVWAGLIFTLSSFSTLPSPEIIWWDFILKKSAHMIEYGIFYLLLVRALSGIPNANHKLISLSSKGFEINKIPIQSKVFFYTFIVAVIYAVSDEYHQSFTPGRHPKLTDVGFDITGMFISFQIIRRKLTSLRHSGKRV